MKTVRLSLLLLLLAGSIWSCTDHRNSPAAPQRLRLKTVSSDNDGTIKLLTEYTYDQMGRQATVFQPGVSRATFFYDGQNRITKYDNKSEMSNVVQRRVFTYSSAPNNGVSVREYVSGADGVIIETQTIDPENANTGSFGFGADGRILSASTGSGSTLGNDIYTYLDNNISSIRSSRSRTEFNYTLGYDDKPNPFYKLITPDFNSALRNEIFGIAPPYSNRNNLTRFSYINRFDGSVINETNYEYEYNAQGLPIKRRVKGGTSVTIYTYESY